MAGAGKEADGGKTEVGEVTNALESPGGEKSEGEDIITQVKRRRHRSAFTFHFYVEQRSKRSVETPK